MQTVSRFWCVVALLAAACGSPDLAPKSPIATIEGTIVGSSSSALTVEVPGSDAAATTTNASGSFVLTNVPSGAAFLRFSGAGVHATLAVVAVVDAEYRRLTVTVTATDAKESHERTETEFHGKVTAISGKTLTIAGRAVTGTDKTEIRVNGAAATLDAIRIGATIEVNGGLLADGSVVARRISIDDRAGHDDPNALSLAGVIAAIDGAKINVSGLTVNLAATTEIYRGDAKIDATGLKVGEHVLVYGVVQADKSINASRIRVLLPEGAADFHVSGSITAITAADGTLKIGETLIATDAHTEFEGDGVHGLADLKVGDKADAEVVRRADHTLLAKKIHRFSLPPPPPPTGVEAHGNIEAVGQDGITVASTRFLVDAKTIIHRGDATVALGDLKVGEAAWVKGYVNADGKLVAARILVAPPPPPPPSGDIEVKAAIDAVGIDGISVGGHRFAVTATTVITRGDAAVALSTLRVGEMAYVKGSAHDGTLFATLIHVAAH